ncbi:MAG: TolC family protein, partial [Pirellulaceae bacterium]|nr:TolC family protein [Pirellulaceae bacterium]
GVTALSYNAYYNNSNSPTREFPSDWNTDVTAEFRQPLFQGAGVQFNRIAGPGAIPGYNNGVIIARIQTDIALADFENSVRVFVRDVEQAYWTLYLAYRELDAVVAGRDAALATWRRVKALQDQGAKGGEADQEAQARGQYWAFVSEMEQRRNNVFAAEAQLRYMMGLAVADGRQIRPSQEPTPAKVSFDWREAMCEAMSRNVDLRRQKWRVKERELELIAAKNYLLPQLDAVGQYRWRGLGDDFWYANRTGQPYDTAMQNLTSGDHQDWRFGLELSLPIGFRKEMAGVRHAQLNLARDRELLREQELEVTHQLASAIRDTELGIQLIRDNYEYSVATKHEVGAVKIAYETGTTTLNVLLEAQRRAAEAEVAYYRALVNYNLSIVDVHFRKGSLLEYNGIWLAEGPWAGKAYFDARRRAQARDAGIYMNYGFTRPKVISRGEYQQQAGPGFTTMPADEGMPMDGTMMFEEINPPLPEGASTTGGSGAYSAGAIGPRLSGAARPRDTIAQKAAALFNAPASGDASFAATPSQPVAAPGVQPVNYDAEPATEPAGVQAAANEAPNAPIPLATPQWKSR